MEYAETDYVFLVDVDFVPSMNLSESLEVTALKRFDPLTTYGDRSEPSSGERRCFIVPAFEIKESKDPLPNTKGDLLSLWGQGFVQPFRHEIWTAGHTATDYAKWKEISEPYEVTDLLMQSVYWSSSFALVICAAIFIRFSKSAH
ncbi:unnamed protein product [Dicrocoelium dendriticum]|nr:unnamed protein product [Dicrocoelium dendriticum]